MGGERGVCVSGFLAALSCLQWGGHLSQGARLSRFPLTEALLCRLTAEFRASGLPEANCAESPELEETVLGLDSADCCQSPDSAVLHSHRRPLGASLLPVVPMPPTACTSDCG